jgi:gliding motility-associated lipoprotein GldB
MTVRNKTRRIYLFFLTAALLCGCNHGNKPDLSNIQVDAKIARFDKEFDEMRTKPMAQQAAYLQQRYGAFYHDFMVLLLQDPDVHTNDTAYFVKLRQVFANRDYAPLKHDVDSIYPNLDKQETQLTEAFKYIKYYFPEQQLPHLYAYFSGFEAQTVISNNYFGIGLDQFLGGNSRFYPALTAQYPRYLSRAFNPDNICPRVVEGLISENICPESDSDKTLLSKMIYNGKIMYLMDRILPDVSDTLKIGYTAAQLKWCQDFEPKIWGYFLDEDLIYKTDDPVIQKFIGETPFTPGLGDDNKSAPKLGVWTGWQIVRKYMEKHPEMSPADLVRKNNAQEILNESGYHPK